MTTPLDMREADSLEPDVEVDSQYRPVYARGTLQLLAPVLDRRERLRIWLGVGFAVAAMGLMGLIPLVQQVILDDTILSEKRSRGVWIVLLLVTGLVSFVANYLRRTIGGRAAVRVQRDLQIKLHRHMQYLDASRRDELRAGDVMSQATSDLTLIQMFLQQLGLAYGNVTLLIVSLAVMVALSPLLAAVMLVAVPVFLAVAMRFRSRSFPASWMDQRFQGSVAGVVEEAVTGVRVVKAFGQEEQEQASLNDEARKLFQSRLRTARITAVFGAGLDAIPGLTQLAILGFGGWLVMEDQVSLGVFLAFSSYVLQLVAPVRFLSGLMATSQQARAGAQRVVELLSTQARVQERPHAVRLENPEGLVELDHVDFRYPGGDVVLHDISLRVNPGERIAIVGASGSGKSTLAHLIARFHDPTSGAVRIDGRDIREYTLTSLRAAVGIVFEEGFLFGTTIRDNIAFGRPTATTDEVEHAAVAAHAHGFIAGLPEGYDTVVGERGFTLSGGQRQRLALARAALTSPQVLILDDATSAIDARTEHAIHRSLGEVLAERTTVLIAHRHSTLLLADRVIVLDHGRIVDVGTTEELLESSQLFRELLTGPDADFVAEPEEPVTELDPAAWPGGVSRLGAPKISSHTSEAATRAASGSHGPGMSGDTSTLAGLATVSPTLLQAVERLPELRGEPDIDLAEAVAPHDQFTMGSVFRSFTKPLLLASAMVVVDAVSWIATPVLIRLGIDHGVLQSSHRTLAWICVALLAIQGVIWINSRVMIYFAQLIAERMLFGLRVRTFAHLQRLSLNYYEQHMAGKIMTRMTSDVEAFAQLLQQGLLTAMVSLLACAGIAVGLVVFDPRLALAVSAVLPVLLVSTLWFRSASGKTYLIARHRVSVLYADMQESLAGVAVSQAYSQQQANEQRFTTLADSYCEARIRSAELIARFFPVLQLLSTVAKAIALAVAAPRVIEGDLSYGLLIAFLLYLDQFFTPIQQLSFVFDQWLQAKVAVVQLRELLQTPTGTPLAEDPVAPKRLSGRISLDRVTFAYESTGLVAMDHVSLEIPPGQVVALVGTTGAGKSTLVKLVARFYDTSAGTVSLDGIPIKQLDLAAYRHQLGFVPQEPFLFSGTIRSNIAYGTPEAPDLLVERAARAVGAHAFIAALPLGYHTPVSEQGRSLSAGQRQLLSLARALLVDPAILLLDEATANLDLATEARVQRAMGLVARGRTTLLIAHRLQTARASQRILVVDNGLIVEDGSHDELLKLGGHYAALWAAMMTSTAHSHE
ncbi:ABC transporter ATP-binding protein [Streptomyces sp. HC44]|uniref:ABC transporter ATP-binding protein n=1 Tax=Streptomyces scabichelini TaxID=2711217 RepID=A0A6G4UX40_9ACTN|nr:ABC transporter ATP-binding protein [Streptomyces scabichelini]NGO06257.1 ABC transporter ATP-binding protein [Streptomyces scabichelini]